MYYVYLRIELKILWINSIIKNLLNIKKLKIYYVFLNKFGNKIKK